MLRIRRNKKGFTLVELMVVAVIVAILAAVLTPIMRGQKIRAFGTEAEAAMGIVRNALRLYHAEHSQYPTLDAGAVEGRISGILTDDLLGTFFSSANYTIESTDAAYVITCDLAAAGNAAPRAADVSRFAHTVTLDETGTFIRSY